MIEEPATVIAKQRGKRNTTLSLLAGALGTSLTIILHLVQMQRADAEKRELAERASTAMIDSESIGRQLERMAGQLAATREDIAGIRERLARVETTISERGKR